MELTPETVKGYYLNSDFYAAHIKRPDYKPLLAALTAFSVLLALFIISFDRFFIPIMVLVVVSVVSGYKFVLSLFKRWKWLALVEKISLYFKNPITLTLRVNDQGLGFFYNQESNFYNWADIKSFQLNKSYLLISNENNFSILPLTNCDKITMDFIAHKLANLKSVKTEAL